MPFNSKYPYMRYRDETTRQDIGTDTIQTSGDVDLTGRAVLVTNYKLHSYQVLTLGAGPWNGEFRIDVSNDNVHWTNICNQTINVSEASGLAYSDEWTFSYARPSITGAEGNFLINERHLA